MLSLLTTLAAAITAVAAQASDASLVAELITANSQVTKIMDLPVGIFSVVVWDGPSHARYRLTRNMCSTF
jgi:predicted cation transporter